LNGILLLVVLLVLNILAYVGAPAAGVDFTASGFYTLSTQSENILRGLSKPTTIIVLLPRSDWLNDEVRVLLDNCRRFNDKIQVDYLSPDVELKEFARLKDRYKSTLVERGDLLIIYGAKNEEKTHVVKRNDLEKRPEGASPQQRDARPLFNGEAALITALKSVSDDQPKTVYFLQGNGELDLGDSAAGRPEEQASALKRHLKKDGYDVKALYLGAPPGFRPPDSGVAAKSIFAPRNEKDARPSTNKDELSDVATLVIAGPRKRLSEEALRAIATYLDPPAGHGKGKLIALLGPVIDGGKMVETGLEPLLLRYSVQIANDRILQVGRFRDAEKLLVMAPLRATNPIATSFGSLGYNFLLDGCRTVSPPAVPGPGVFAAEPLLWPTPYQLVEQIVWSETNLSADPPLLAKKMAQEINSNRNKGDELFEKWPKSLAVAVSERAKPADPRMPAQGGEDETPRIVVFGNTTFAANPNMEEGRAPGVYYDLFGSSLAWLRERPQQIGVRAKEFQNFSLAPDVDLSLLILQPALMMTSAIVALGTGVWIVRRR
jgi:hypothetical protein